MNKDEYIDREFPIVDTKIEGQFYINYIESNHVTQRLTDENGSLLLAKQMIEIERYITCLH